ncbi:MAG: SdrD B-like domain-containing protein [Caldilineaceae bacterium]
MFQKKRTDLFLRITATLLCSLQLAAAWMVVQPAAVALADTAISGTVFQDYNANGVRDSNLQVNNSGQGQIGLAVDKGVAGVLVTAYDASGAAVGNATSGNDGQYQLTASGSPPYRLEFTNLPTGYQPGPVGANNGSTVRFVEGAATDVDLGIIIPSEYCQNNPQLIANCYRFGDAINGNAANFPTIVGFPYSAGSSTFDTLTGAAEPTTHTLSIKVNQVGTTWGLAYARSSKRIYASAFYRKHSGFGPGGPGAVYVIDPATNNVISTLTVPGATTNAHDTSNYDTDNGVVGFDAAGKTSLGGIALSPDEKTLYVMNLENRTLYALNTSTGAVITSQTVPAQPPLVAPATVNACRPGDVRPFAVTYYQGKLYIGMVCSAESAPDADPDDFTDGDGNQLINWGDVRELRLYVYEADPTSLAFAAQPIFSAPLNYPRASAFGGGNTIWNPWISNWDRANNPVAGTRVYPQPILSDITFENGNLILGLRDRFGDQTGLILPYGSNSTLQEGAMVGATLRACGDPQNGWTLEDNARCNGLGTQPPNTGHGPGTLSLTPPYTSSVGYGSYYNVHAFETHSGDSFGGLAWIPGYADFVNTGMRPGRVGNSGGIYWLNATSGAKTKGYQLYAGDDIKQPPYSYGKANGMGDVLVLCDSAPIEIGNRVWLDANGNGIQDAGEQGISGVAVELYRAGVKVAETTTAGDGTYLFNNSNVTLNGATGIVPGTGTQGGDSEYEIRIPANQVALNGLAPTAANVFGDANVDLRDSDGQLVGFSVNHTIPFAALAEAGFNNHTFDFGFDEPAPLMSLGNKVWFDTNNDGLDNDGTGGAAGSSTGIANVNVKLYLDSNFNDVFDSNDTFVDETTTTSKGCYAFSGLPPSSLVEANYLVVIPNSNFVNNAVLNTYSNSTGEPTTDDDVDRNDDGRPDGSGNIVSSPISLDLGSEPTIGNGEGDDGDCNLAGIDANTNQTVDFGFYRLELGNQVWNDANNNGLLDNGEQGIDGVAVDLLDGQGAVVQSTTTANGGFYLFQGFARGIYQVRITAPAGYVSSTPDAGDPDVDSADNNDNGNGSSGGQIVTSQFSIQPGSTNGGANVNAATGVTSNPNVDFGVRLPLNLGNLVWQDRNNNGKVDSGENGLSNVLVQLFHASDNPASAVPLATDTTDGNGIYGFGDLTPGQYRVCIPTPPAQYPTSSIVTDSNDDGKDNDDNGIQTVSGGLTCSPVIQLTAGLEPTNDGDGANGDLTIDLGFYGAVSVGDRVWYDDNKNGLQDQGEQGVKAVQVTLFDAVTGQAVTKDIDGNPIQPQQTNGNGNYLFNNLPAGSYYVVFDLNTLPPGYVVTTPNVGSNSEIDSDAAIGTGKTASVTVPSGANLSLDMGIVSISLDEVRVGDYVWFDDNHNGIQDNTESGVANVRVTIFDATTDQPVLVGGNPLTRTTNASGLYLFDGLPVGNYYVVFDLSSLPAGYAPTLANVGSNDEVDSDADANGKTAATGPISAGQQNLSLDLGIFAPYSLGNRVWEDNNNNGVIDSGEAGINGLTVNLYADANNDGTPDGVVLASMATANGGYYRFDGLAAGTYLVEVVAPGYRSSTADAGDPDVDVDDSDDNGVVVNGNSVRSAPVTLGPDSTEPTGETDLVGGVNPQGALDARANMTVDFGFFRLATIGDRVWLDVNPQGNDIGDGIQDAGETGLQGWIVRLYQANGTLVATTTTVLDGRYLFTDLVPGDYFIEFAAPNQTQQFKISQPNQGSDPAQDSDANQVTLRTPVTNLISGEDDRTWDMGVFLVGTGDPESGEPNAQKRVFLPVVVR